MKKLAGHITSLCSKHALKVVWLKNKDFKQVEAFVYKGIRQLKLLPITSPARYAIALHEIGHVLTKSRHKPLLFREALAWEWAKKNALFWSLPMQRAMAKGLQSYVSIALQDYKRALPKQITLPPSDHVFWQLTKDIPEAIELQQFLGAPWLARHLPIVPWGNVMAHPERPRCFNCIYWESVVELETELGLCRHRENPMISRLTPKEAFCGTSWQRKI